MFRRPLALRLYADRLLLARRLPGKNPRLTTSHGHFRAPPRPFLMPRRGERPASTSRILLSEPWRPGNDQGRNLERMNPDKDRKSANLILSEVQLLLAEKRTSLSAIRTGIAVFVLPLSVLSILIATSKFYDVAQVIHLLAPLLTICFALVLLGCFLIIRAIVRIRHYDRLIMKIKMEHSIISEFID